MSASFPEIIRLDKPAKAGVYGIADTPVGALFGAWQNGFLVRLGLLPAGPECPLPPACENAAGAERDDARMSRLVNNILFPNGKWSGIFNPSLRLGFYGTDFQWRVTSAMLHIPAGNTSSYTALAAQSGYAGAARAAGSVCARNPLPFVVPCHRVLASGNKTGHYAYGPALKRFFLEQEGVTPL